MSNFTTIRLTAFRVVMVVLYSIKLDIGYFCSLRGIVENVGI